MSNHDGYIFGHPIEFWNTIVNAGYLGSVILAAIFSVLLWRVSVINGDIKDRAFAQYKYEAGVKISDANERADEATQRAAEADLKVASANEKIAELNASNLQLEAIVSPRRITNVNQGALSALEALAPKTISITSYALDPDGAVLATQILNGLAAQHFTIQDKRMTQGPSTSLLFGVWVFGPDKALVEALVNLLRSAGIQTIDQEPNLGSGVTFNGSISSTIADASIFVGLKPLPDLSAHP